MKVLEIWTLITKIKAHAVFIPKFWLIQFYIYNKELKSENTAHNKIPEFV